MTYKRLYIKLISNKYNNVDKFIRDIQNPDHYIWGVCRDCAEEILMYNVQWKWLSYRVDDFSTNVTSYILEKLPIWYWKAIFGTNSLASKMYSISATVDWVIDRWVAMLKNLFDPRYRFSMEPTYLCSYEEL